MKLITFFSLIILTNLCFAQQVVKCRVLNKNTNEPLPYALITSKTTSIEFLTDEKGFFTKIIDNIDDTIIVSNYIYIQTIIPVKQLLSDSLIFLAPKIRKVSEVAERDIKNFKIREIGYHTQKAKGDLLKIEFGQSAGVVINNDYKDKQVEILLLKFWIHKSFTPVLPLLVSFFEIDNNGNIGKKINSEPIILYVRCNKTDELFQYSLANSKIKIPQNGIYVKFKPLLIGEETKEGAKKNGPYFYTVDRNKKLNIGLEVMVY